MRTWAAQILVGSVACTVLLTFAVLIIKALKSDLTTQDLKDVLSVLYPPLLAVVGTVAGFYFGAKEKA